MEKIDLTYSGELTTLINVMEEEKLDVLYTIDGITGLPTSTSIKIFDDGLNFLMITFNYQELRNIVEKGMQYGNKN